MSMESVAAEAGTTVPAVRRRYPSKASLAAAVVDSLRAEPLPARAREPRATALAILENFHRNLRRPHALAVLGTLLAEEDRNPALMERFRKRLVEPRRAILLQTLEDAQRAGELPPRADLEMIVNMLIGSFYARYVSGGAVRGDWPRRALDAVWPVSTG